MRTVSKKVRSEIDYDMGIGILIFIDRKVITIMLEDEKQEEISLITGSDCFMDMINDVKMIKLIFLCRERKFFL